MKTSCWFSRIIYEVRQIISDAVRTHTTPILVLQLLLLKQSKSWNKTENNSSYWLFDTALDILVWILRQDATDTRIFISSLLNLSFVLSHTQNQAPFEGGSGVYGKVLMSEWSLTFWYGFWGKMRLTREFSFHNRKNQCGWQARHWSC